jgi:hypothetical protein
MRWHFAVRSQHDRRYCRRPYPICKEIDMRKLIMMAIAGFVWKKVQARMARQPATAARGMRRY